MLFLFTLYLSFIPYVNMPVPRQIDAGNMALVEIRPNLHGEMPDHDTLVVIYGCSYRLRLVVTEVDDSKTNIVRRGRR